MSPGHSLQRRLFRQFLWVGLLPLGAVSLLAAGLLSRALLDQGEQRNLELATAVHNQVTVQLAARQRTVLLIASEIATDRLSGEAIGQTLREAVNQDELVLAAYLTNPAGVVEHIALPADSGLRASDLFGLDQSAQPHYQAARQSRQPVWSQTYLSLLTGRITAVLVAPAGERSLFIELALDSLSEALAKIGQTAHTLPIVIDRAGRVIAHPDAHVALRQENLRNLGLVRRAIDGVASSERVRLGDTTYLAQALPVQSVGWTVLVMQPARVVLGPLISLVAVLAGALLLAFLVAAWSSWVLARKSGREVTRLAEAAEALTSNTSAPPLAFEVAEFRAVWERLRSLFDELIHRDHQTQAARRDLQAVLDAATEVAIIATDTQGAVTVFSRGAQKMLLLSAEDVVGHASPIVWHDPEEVAARAHELSEQLGRPVEGFEVFVWRAREAGHEVRDWIFVRADGQRIDVSLAVTAVRGPDGELKGFLGVAIDVSQRRRANELDTARRVADAANVAKSEFLSRMSHELRTPLNAVLGYAQLMAHNPEEPATPKQLQHLAQIERSGWHLVQLIDEVLDLSRIESGHVRVAIGPLAAPQVVAHALEIAEPLMRQQGVQFSVVWHDGQGGQTLLPVLADLTRLTQVLVNLLSNAAKYNRPGGSVRLECVALAGERLMFRVIDTGLGMETAQLAQLFQPFNRLGREGGAIEGTGIGLVITRHLVELMHGTLDVHSVAGEGSVFSLVLPQQPLSPHTLPSPSTQAMPAAGRARGRVLYIEDNEVNATLMGEIMRQRPEVELLLACTVAEGLALCRQCAPDLLLLDMHLPDGDGFSVLDRLAADAACAGIPVIAISADATHAQVSAALARGARAYLTKPIHLVEVLAAVDGVLGSTDRR